MAKISKKNQASVVNPRSRAAKRDTSPGIDVDKSIKQAPRASDATPVLAKLRGSGITKKSKKKQMTRGQRARQEKGLARAEAVMDQMEKKQTSARRKQKTIDTRKRQWDEVNVSSKEETRKAMSAPGRETAEDEWEDETSGRNGDDSEMGSAEPVVSSVPPTLPTEFATKVAVSTEQDEFDLIT